MPPTLEGLFRDRNDLFDLFLASHLGYLADDLVVRRVGHLEDLAGLGRDPFVVDERLGLEEGRVLQVEGGSLRRHGT
jgi:hypothetical protein